MDFSIGLAIGGMIVATWGKLLEPHPPLWVTAIGAGAGSILYTLYAA